MPTFGVFLTSLYKDHPIILKAPCPNSISRARPDLPIRITPPITLFPFRSFNSHGTSCVSDFISCHFSMHLRVLRSSPTWAWVPPFPRLGPSIIAPGTYSALASRFPSFMHLVPAYPTATPIFPPGSDVYFDVVEPSL